MWGCQFGWDISCFWLAVFICRVSGMSLFTCLWRALHCAGNRKNITHFRWPIWLGTSARRSSSLRVTVQYCTYIHCDFHLSPYSSSKRSTGSFRSPVVFQSCLDEGDKAGHDRSLPRHFQFTAHMIFLCFFHALQCIVIKCPTNLTSVL